MCNHGPAVSNGSHTAVGSITVAPIISCESMLLVICLTSSCSVCHVSIGCLQVQYHSFSLPTSVRPRSQHPLASYLVTVCNVKESLPRRCSGSPIFPWRRSCLAPGWRLFQSPAAHSMSNIAGVGLRSRKERHTRLEGRSLAVARTNGSAWRGSGRTIVSLAITQLAPAVKTVKAIERSVGFKRVGSPCTALCAHCMNHGQ
jgi:hypothetical protein